MTQSSRAEVVESSAQTGRPEIYIPRWQELTQYEQVILAVLSGAGQAVTYFEVFRSVVGMRIAEQNKDYSVNKFVDDMEKMGGVNGVMTHYRKLGYKFPHPHVVRETLAGFERAGWVGSRFAGKKQYFFLNSIIEKALKDDLDKKIYKMVRGEVEQRMVQLRAKS